MAVVIYLASSLETADQEIVDYQVAREFAHVILDCTAMEEVMEELQDATDFPSADYEQQADRLVAAWGYEIPRIM